MTPATQIDGLELKLRQLAAKVDRQRAQYEAARAENDNLQRELDRQLGIVSTLKDKLERTTTTASKPVSAGDNGQSVKGDNADHRDTLEYCLREIDSCLDWLHRN